MRLIVAVDPGNVCGIATFDLDERDHETHELGPIRTCAEVDRAAEAGTLAAIICETFRPRHGVYTWQPDALYTFGALRYLAAKHDVPFVPQDPPPKARRVSLITRIEELGWRRRTKDDHSDMANMHLLMFAEKRGIL